MRQLLFIQVMIFFSVVVSANEREVFRLWNVTTASVLEIHGTTNINSFQCATSYYDGSDIIRETWNPGNEKWEILGSLIIEVNDFDCQNRVMNNDFRNTLNADKHPEIKIEFLNLREIAKKGSDRVANGMVEISLAGKKRKYQLSCDIIYVSDQHSILRGKQVFRFSDFGLDPPQKGFGLIKVNDEITVSFDLILEQSYFSGNLP
jgi:hypothetical protein